MMSTTGNRVSERAFWGVSALLFASSALVTIISSASMSAMGGMSMPGGWTMSMAWMRMPGQSWAGATTSFVGMWIVMMAAMMLPSLVPMLQRYHAAVVGASLVSGSGAAGGAHIAVGMRVPRLGWLTTLVGLGYFFVWTVFGLIVYPIGITIADIEMQQPALSRAVPTAIGLVVLIAGALQFTAWKAHHLMCCREEPRPGHALAADAGTAWRLGMRLGLHCSYSSIGMTAILLVVGVMDLRAMAIVTAAITLERLAPSGERIARAIGAVTIAAGVMLMARAAGLA